MALAWQTWHSKVSQYQTYLEAFVVLWIVWFLVKRFLGSSENQRSRARDYSDEEVAAKLASFNPEPLITPVSKEETALKCHRIESRLGKRVVVDGIDCLNLVTHDYLGMTEKKEIEENAVKAVRKYGVGACGPRGFYGTVDVHLKFEEKLAKFLGTEEAIMYAYAFSTIASAIPAYSKRNDVIFVDEKVNFAIQKGLDASRSTVHYFKHNDYKDLERILAEEEIKASKKKMKTCSVRRFLVIEGIYINTGEICPLPELIALRQKYKLRIFLDESVSFGVLGKNGRGVTEHFGIPVEEVDLIMGSMENAIGSIGGFCAGSSFIVEHQRLSGSGYIFSAALPPLLTNAAITALEIMESQPEILEKLKNNCSLVSQRFQKSKYLQCSSSLESPIKHLYLKGSRSFEEEQKLLETVSQKCLQQGLAVISPLYLKAERVFPRPSLRICISAELDKSDIAFAVEVLEQCVEKVLGC